MRYLLDTNVCIAYLKGSESVLRHMAAQDPASFVLSDIVKAELYYGARKSRRVADNLAVLDLFFAQFPSLAFDDNAAREYGMLRVSLEAAGRPIGPYDMQIAATALANDLVLITHNVREFQCVPNLRWQDWEG